MTDEEDFAGRLMDMSNASVATDLLLMVSGQAQETGAVKISMLQGLSNTRAMARGQYQLTEEAIKACEDWIRQARKTGTADPNLRNLDPEYFAYLMTGDEAFASAGPRRHTGPPKVSPADTSVDLDALELQFRGRKFGELILHHRKRTDMPTTIAALQGVIQELPEEARPLVESWIDETNPSARSESFWQQDCGDALAAITMTAATRLRAAGVEPTASDLFNMFQVLVLNFAYSTHCHAQSKAFIQKAVGMGFVRRLFG